RDEVHRVLRVLRSRDYLLFWSGSFIANLGVWMQQIALGWLVYDLTRRASLLGTVSFCGNAPILVLGLVGGAIADRASRRTIMLGTLGVIAATALTVAPPPVGRALREGLGYARRHPVIAPSLVLVAVMSVFGFPYIILLPALARDTLHLDATGLGYLMAAVGAGAVTGGLGLSAVGDG